MVGNYLKCLNCKTTISLEDVYCFSGVAAFCSKKCYQAYLKKDTELPFGYPNGQLCPYCGSADSEAIIGDEQANQCPVCGIFFFRKEAAKQ